MVENSNQINFSRNIQELIVSIFILTYSIGRLALIWGKNLVWEASCLLQDCCETRYQIVGIIEKIPAIWYFRWRLEDQISLVTKVTRQNFLQTIFKLRHRVEETRLAQLPISYSKQIRYENQFTFPWLSRARHLNSWGSSQHSSEGRWDTWFEPWG